MTPSALSQDNKILEILAKEILKSWWFKNTKIKTKKTINTDIPKIEDREVEEQSKTNKSIYIMKKIIILSKYTYYIFLKGYYFTRKIIDKAFTYLLLSILKIIRWVINSLIIQIEKYIKNIWYSDMWQFEKKLSKTEMAFIAQWIPEDAKMTVHDIMHKYKVSYHYALQINKMRKGEGRLEAMKLVTEYYKKNINN